jgi:formylglycine-generating enzyme required for sulfatase activity/predicted alpha/beta superfamily hydrolase
LKRPALLALALVPHFGTLVPPAAATPITVGESVKVTSKVLGEERTVLVATPPGYERAKRSYPVVYLTDGETQFLHTRATVDFLARNGLMPAAIVVGVTNTDRTRDLTPTRADMTGADGAVVRFPTSGGADRFLDFLETELIPWVESHYRTEPYRIFCGHSFGGLLAAHAFLTRPDLFNAVVAVSPTFLWDDRVEVKRAAAFFAGRKALKRTFVMTVGSEGPQMERGFEAFEKVLKGSRAEGFVWAAVTFPEDDHGSVVMRSHDAAFRKIFEGWHLARDPLTGNFKVETLGEVKARFAALSGRLGHAFLPPEALVNRLGYQALGKKDFGRSLEFFRYNAATYPDSANVWDSLGETLEAEGKREEAFESYAKAAALGEKNGDPNTVAFRKNEARLGKELGKAVPSPGALPPPGTVRRDEKWVEQVWVPAGTFRMGTDAAEVAELLAQSPPKWVAPALSREEPAHEVTITRGLWIDRTEVTNGGFRAFVDAGGYATRALWSDDGWRWLTEKASQPRPAPCDGEGAELPRRCVTWYEAEAYARWRGGRLPTEAEWEWAARGPRALRYPWGNGWDPALCNVAGSTSAVAVGRYPAGASWTGALDMAGNAMEWVSDWLAPYGSAAATDPVGPAAGTVKVEKGGWWGANLFVARSAYRHFEDPPDYADHHIGFRVVSP